jgi:hypothetical protein
MGSAEGFLARWSRRKRLSAARAREPADTTIPATAAETPPVSPAPTEAVASQRLPPIESLEAGTDITPFLAPGVPAELTRQALRRAWSADPAIRDFIGLSENAWDFTAAGGVPGFGTLSAEDAGRLLSQALGTARSGEVPPAATKVAVPSGNTAADVPQADRDGRRGGDSDAGAGTAQDFDEKEINRPPSPS